jgi:hypothetical protein
MHELRADRVTNPEQEQQEQKGFGHARHGHMRELPDEQAGEKGTCDRAQAECSYLEAANPVAHRNDQKQRELRIADQKLLKPSEHGELSSSGAVFGQIDNSDHFRGAIINDLLNPTVSTRCPITTLRKHTSEARRISYQRYHIAQILILLVRAALTA